MTSTAIATGRARQGKTDRPPKNRVGGFSSYSETRARFFVTQPLESHRKKTPTPTTAASGMRFYGYRYYMADLARWVSRDPLGETASLNMVAYLHNEPINIIDYLGLDGCFPVGSPIIADSLIIPLGSFSHTIYTLVSYSIVTVVATPIVFPIGGVIIEGKTCNCTCEPLTTSYEAKIECYRYEQPMYCEYDGMCGKTSASFNQDLGWSGGPTLTPIGSKKGDQFVINARPYHPADGHGACHMPCLGACSAIGGRAPGVTMSGSCSTLAAFAGK